MANVRNIIDKAIHSHEKAKKKKDKREVDLFFYGFLFGVLVMGAIALVIAAGAYEDTDSRDEIFHSVQTDDGIRYCTEDLEIFTASKDGNLKQTASIICMAP